MLVKTKIRFLFFALSLAALLFTTCDSPMGMGSPIDWEPPVLLLDPVPNPLYVRNGTRLTGQVTDNVGVDRVIFTNSATGEELFRVAVNGDRFEIELLFSSEQNGEKIIAQIAAYDKAGNCGASSIAFVTLIIDIRPPIIQSIKIKRTDSKLTDIESYAALRNLEETDRNGDNYDNLYRYQNGWFYIDAVVSDEETKVKDIVLNLYDWREPNTVLLSLPVDEGYTSYFPRWTIKEEDIIAAGSEVLDAGLRVNYKSDYYDRGLRYYYRVTVVAIDMSENTSETTVEEDEGYICLWERSDEPRGIVEPTIGTNVPRGNSIPVNFFDDDSLLWAYTGLLTEDQWYGLKPVYTGNLTISSGEDKDKLQWLKERLTGAVGDSVTLGAGAPIYNWNYDKHNSGFVASDNTIKELIEGANTNTKDVQLLTGNREEDYGDFILFTIAADHKLSPHDGQGPERTNKDIWSGRVYRVSIIDENNPLIVFDTPNGCPEENTFPALTSGEFFEIKGYTLREDTSGLNSVVTFRMAWIPFGMGGTTADNYISNVQKALSASNYPYSINSDGSLLGIQHWEFRPSGGAGYGNFVDGSESLTGTNYRKQSFSKKFSVLGGQDDIKTADSAYKNFVYNDVKAQNETKLFVFYAMDNMGHEVFRQLRLLGMKTQPSLVVYDISNRLTEDTLDGGNMPPDPNSAGYADSNTGGVTQAYYNALNLYNKRPTVYTALSGKGKTLSPAEKEEDKTIPFQIYPRGTVLKYWVEASKEGDIGIDSITMKDITYSGQEQVVGSGYSSADQAYSFCEYYPDVTQRTFLFEAEDKLGNVARIQRTVAVTNAARLENITTTELSGTYGMNKKIILKANFSSQVYVEGTGSVQLNVLIKKGAVYTPSTLTCASLPTLLNPALSLDFEFTVQENDDGQLMTVYEGLGSGPDYLPIKLNGTAKIMDYLRRDSAFIPGYRNESVIMPNWSTEKNSLQEKKTIDLYGIRPLITAVTVGAAGGKTAYTDSNYYFKAGETIEFTLASDKAIRASDSPLPRLQYYIRDAGGTLRGPFTSTAFSYSRPNGTTALVFSLPVNDANCTLSGTRYDGELSNVTLVTSTGKIMDNFDNEVNTAAIPVPAAPRIFIKQTRPVAPAATLSTTSFATAQVNWNSAPVLAIPVSPSPSPSGINWEDIPQYSLNGGKAWVGASSYNISTDGTYDLRARYVDRAGNEGFEISKTINVKINFPKLIAASTVQPNGWYTQGSNLTFNLSFDDTVTVTTAANVKITLKDAVTGASIDVTADTPQTNVTTVKFSWTGITGVEMPNGLYISDVVLTGLSDPYGSTGQNITGIGVNAIITTGCSNLPTGGIKVDAVVPTVSTRAPVSGAQSTADQSVTQIQLTFSENVMKGSGTITVRPRAGYAIPAVFEDTGYYLGTDGTTRYNTSGANRTYMPSFYDIYNNGALTVTQRGYLTQGTTMSALTLHTRTGQSYGPYKKTTHGLIEGRGYTGNYNNTTPGANGPSPGLGNVPSTTTPLPAATLSMIPDTATKWVLDYQYGITQNIAAVTNIRAALTAAKFRWQEIDVVSTVINNNVVTINLNEPLLKGLEWDVYYPAGTFTDMAGNPAAASGYNAAGAMLDNNGDYWFTSSGVQAPVIRVNRRSYDARDIGWASQNRNYNPPPVTTAGWNAAGFGYNDNPATGAGNGWGINDFNYVHYRVESESPDATITAKTFQGVAGAGGSGKAVGAWTGNVSAANPGVTLVGDMAWNAAATATAGTWVTSNIIRRAAANQTYSVITKNGTPESRTSQGAYRGFRSYNRDLTKTELNAAGTAATLNNGHGMLTFAALEANKSYVVATATKGTGTLNNATGLEGIFRTVIALNFDAQPTQDYLVVEGSNVKNGMPSIAGFPVRDAEETGDNRFVKYFHKISGDRTNFYWVSTEIVCEWYFLSWGGGGTHQSVGEVNNYQTVGYGDLTYGFNITR
jgi:hypothetical protein